MRLYIDVDAICKCGHWALLDQLAIDLGFDWRQSVTLQSVKFRAAKACGAPDGKLFRTVDAAQSVMSVVNQMEDEPQPLVEMVELLSNAPGLDPGEVTLFSSAGAEDVFVLTGDKRALRGLAKITACEEIKKLHGKFICLEMVILIMLDDHGLEWVREKICPHRDLDRAVLAILGSTCSASEESVREALASYIKDLHHDCVEFLCPEYL